MYYCKRWFGGRTRTPASQPDIAEVFQFQCATQPLLNGVFVVPNAAAMSEKQPAAEDLATKEARQAMLAVARSVKESQIDTIDRLELGYSEMAFNLLAHRFLLGALFGVSERYAFPTGQREVAAAGVLDYLLRFEGWSFERARRHVALLHNDGVMLKGSVAEELFQLGYGHWEQPHALRTYLAKKTSNMPYEWTERSQVRWKQRRLALILLGCVAIVASVAVFYSNHFH